jgi:WD40 repeat protein
MDPNKYGRINPDIPLIRGHTSPVVDLRFSPLNPNILATGSDGKI